MKRPSRPAWTRIVFATCAGTCACVSAQAQVLPRVPQAPLAAASAASGPGVAQLVPAPTTYAVPSVAVLGVQSSNANFGAGNSAQSDSILQVVPRLFLASDHARWRVRADLSVLGTYYARGTEPDVVVPQGSANLHSELIDRLFFFDAGFNAQQYATSPYVSQGGPVQGSSYSSTQWRLSPYIDRLLRPGLRLTVRSDDTWTGVSNTGQNTGIFGGRYLDQSARLEQVPLDWGYTLAARQTYATYNDEPFAWMRDTVARGILNYAVTPRWVVGGIGGRERVQAFDAEDNSSIYGVRTRWNGPQGQAQVSVEHRYFGTGWDASANIGSPRMRASLDWYRGTSSYLAPLSSNNNAITNVSGLLDSLLAGQYPNPLLRAQAVENLLGNAGLPPGLPTSGGFFTASTVLQNNLVLTGLLLRPRDSFALSLYRNRTEDLFLPGQGVLQLIQTQSADNLQSGAAFNYGHRLTPLDTLNLTVQREIDTGFGLNQGNNARQTNVIVQIDHRLSLRSIAIAGVRRRFLDSSLVGRANETGLFLGLVHRF